MKENKEYKRKKWKGIKKGMYIKMKLGREKTEVNRKKT